MSNLMLDVDQAGELKAAFRRGNWTNEEIKRACEGDLLARFRQVVLGLSTIEPKVQVGEPPKLILPEPKITTLAGVVLPDKSLSLAKRIKAGEYTGGVDGCITADRFPITLEAGPADLVTAHFGVDMEDTAVDAWMKAHLEYQDALIEELLAVGCHREHRNLQVEFPIIARGSSTVVNGSVGVPYLGYWDDGRDLRLDYRYGWWAAGCRFLLRKVSKPLVA